MIETTVWNCFNRMTIVRYIETLCPTCKDRGNVSFGNKMDFTWKKTPRNLMGFAGTKESSE